MLALRSFAQSTLGELKGALVEVDTDGEESDEEASPSGLPSRRAGASPKKTPAPSAEAEPSPESWRDAGATARAQAAREQAARAIAAARAVTPAASLDDGAAAIGASAGSSALVSAANGSAERGVAGGVALTGTAAPLAASGSPAGPVDDSGARADSCDIAATSAGHFTAGASSGSAASAIDAEAVTSAPASLSRLGAADAVSSPPATSESEAALTATAVPVGGESPGADEGSPRDADWVDCAEAKPETDETRAQKQFEKLFSMPGLPELLGRLREDRGASPGADAVADAWWRDCAQGSAPTALPCPRLAALSCEAALLLAPCALAAGADSDARRLLQSYDERYDALLRRFVELEQRSAAQASSLDAARREAAAQRQRAEASASGGAAALQEEVRRLSRLLAQRDEEVRCAGEALRQLQEVMDEGDGAAGARVARLERELAEARRSLEVERGRLSASDTELREAREEVTASARHAESLAARCSLAEKEARENGIALQELLREKEDHIEEKGRAVDRQLVVSMLGLCMDHLSTGHKGLAEQVLSQTVQIFGGCPGEAERQRIRAAAAAAEAERVPRGPLGDAFFEFLDQEARGASGQAATAPVVAAQASASAASPSV